MCVGEISRSTEQLFVLPSFHYLVLVIVTDFYSYH